MNVAGARLARQAADEVGGFVAGSVGPLNVTLSLSPKVDDAAYRAVTFDEVCAAYADQMTALVEGGVDLFLIETVFDTLNAKAAIAAALDVAPEVPRWICFTAIDASGRNLSGQTVEAFWRSVEHAEPLIVGVNCSLGATEMRPYVESPLGRCVDVRLVPPERRPPERARSPRRAAGRHESLPTRVRRGRSRQRRRRLLRDDAGARAGDRRRDPRPGAEADPGGRAPDRFQRPRAFRHRARHRLRAHRRAHERHRVCPLPPPDRGGRLPGGARRRARPGTRRRQPYRREHGR